MLYNLNIEYKGNGCSDKGNNQRFEDNYKKLINQTINSPSTKQFHDFFVSIHSEFQQAGVNRVSLGIQVNWNH